MDGTFCVRPSVCFEVEKITGIFIGEGKQRNYQVQWAPTWISSTHLVGCEHLIDEFLCQQSEKGEAVDHTVTGGRISTCDLQIGLTDKCGSVAVWDSEMPASTQKVTEVCEKACMTENNDHLPECFRITESNGNLTALSADKGISNSGCQVTDMLEDNQVNPSHELVERSIEGGGDDIQGNVNNDNVDINTTVNANTGNGRFLLDNQDMNSLLQSDLELTVEAEPHLLSKDTTTINTSLNCTICRKVFKNSSALSEHNRHLHRKMWKCALCDRQCKNKAGLQLHHMNKHKRQCIITPHMMSTHDGLGENVFDNTDILTTDKIHKQTCVDVDLSENSSSTKVLFTDKVMLNSGCQITYHQLAEPSTECINIDGDDDIGSNVNSNMHVHIDTAANAKGDNDKCAFGRRDLKPLHFSAEDAGSDYQFQSVLEVNKEEIMTVENVTDESTLSKDLSKDIRKKIKLLRMKECNICHNLFKDSRGLSVHYSKIHWRQWQCDICNRVCDSEATLLEHKRKHKKIRPTHKCSYCDKLCAGKNRLIEHLRACEKTFKRRQVLQSRSHQQHTGLI